MKVFAITGFMCLALAAPAMGQAKSNGNASSSGAPSKAALEATRKIVHELEGHTEKLRELLSNHGSLVDRKPQSKEELAKWEAALDRLLVRVEAAHASVVETTQRLDKSITGELPTGLGKDVARVKNEAEPERVMAEQILAKRKRAPASKAKKAPAEKPAPPNNEEYDL